MREPKYLLPVFISLSAAFFTISSVCLFRNPFSSSLPYAPHALSFVSGTSLLRGSLEKGTGGPVISQFGRNLPQARNNTRKPQRLQQLLSKKDTSCMREGQRSSSLGESEMSNDAGRSCDAGIIRLELENGEWPALADRQQLLYVCHSWQLDDRSLLWCDPSDSIGCGQISG